MGKVVLACGGFDPIHDGHLDYLQGASLMGKLIVAVNSDAWVLRKKGYTFLPWGSRARIIGSFPWVYAVVPFNDFDDTATEAILHVKPDIFVKSGDRKSERDLPTVEIEACKAVGAQIVFGVGGPANARWHSSDLVRDAGRQILDPELRTESSR